MDDIKPVAWLIIKAASTYLVLKSEIGLFYLKPYQTLERKKRLYIKEK